MAPIWGDRNDPLPAPKHKHEFLLKLDKAVECATDVPFTKHEAELASIFLAGLLDLIDRSYDRDNKRRQPRTGNRIMRVKFRDLVENATTNEVFYVEGKGKRFRRIKAPHEHDCPCSADELKVWFRSLGITHVEHVYGNTEGDGVTQLKDGMYPVDEWLGWARGMEEDV